MNNDCHLVHRIAVIDDRNRSLLAGNPVPGLGYQADLELLGQQSEHFEGAEQVEQFEIVKQNTCYR